MTGFNQCASVGLTQRLQKNLKIVQCVQKQMQCAIPPGMRLYSTLCAAEPVHLSSVQKPH